MKVAGITAAALALAAPSQPVLSQRDFNQIIDVAVANAAESWMSPTVQRICVQRELEPPFHAVKQWIDESRQASGTAGVGTTNLEITRNPAIDRWIPAAMAPSADVAPQTVITSLPKPYILFSAGGPTPSQCVVDHVPAAPGQSMHDTAVTLTFTRPVLAGGFVFVDEVDGCPGLCGDGVLNVYQKQHGKWTRVAQQILWVS